MSILLGIVVILLTLVIGFGQPEREAAPGIRRWMWMLVGIGMLEMILLPTWPQRILLSLVLLHTQLSFPPSAHERFLMQVLIVVGGYLALLPIMSSGEWSGMIVPFLWLLVGIGTLTGFWAMLAVQKSRANSRQGITTTSTYETTRVFRIGLWVYEMLERPKLYYMTAGHLNTNFTQPLVCMFLAADVRLIIQGSWIAVALCPIILFPLIVHAIVQKMPGQWVVHSFVLLCLVSEYFYGIKAVYVIGTLGGMVAVGTAIRYFEPHIDTLWWDSGRFYEWWNVLKLWWNCQSWLIRLIGGGIRSWLQASTDLTYRKATAKNNYTAPLFSAAHNEYLQQLFEYGLVGAVALVWYTVDVLTKAHALNTGLFWVTCLLASTAMLTFPWTFYHTVNIEMRVSDTQNKVVQTRHGSPLLVWLTLLITLLVEA